MTYAGLTTAGLDAPRGADFLTLIRSGIVSRLTAAGLPADVDWERDVAYGVLSACTAAELGRLSELMVAIHNGYDPASAVGFQLDVLADIMGVRRLAASASTATVTFTGTAGTAIPAGTVVKGGGTDGDARWATTADATVASGGTVDVAVQCTVDGPTTAAVGELSTIVTLVPGVTAATNAAAATAGAYLESDTALRARMLTARYRSGAASANGILAGLLAQSFIDSAVVLENDTTAAATIDGVSVTANSVMAIVHPDTLTDAQKTAMVQEIYLRTTAGIRTDGAQSATVTKADGFAKTVRWSWATAVPVTVAYTLVLETGFALSDVAGPLQEAVEAYFTGLQVNGDLYLLDFYAIADTIPGIKNVSGLTLNGSSSLTADADEIFTYLACTAAT